MTNKAEHTSMFIYHLCTLISVQFSCSVASNSLQPHGLQHARPPCPSPTPGVYSNSCPLSQWYHPTTSSSIMPFSYHLQSFPASRSFQMSQFFTSGGQSIRASASASVLPMTIQGWFPWGLTGLISLLSKGLSRFVVGKFYLSKAIKAAKQAAQCIWPVGHNWLPLIRIIDK